MPERTDRRRKPKGVEWMSWGWIGGPGDSPSQPGLTGTGAEVEDGDASRQPCLARAAAGTIRQALEVPSPILPKWSNESDQPWRSKNKSARNKGPQLARTRRFWSQTRS